jgi:hypothetical protein
MEIDDEARKSTGVHHDGSGSFSELRIIIHHLNSFLISISDRVMRYLKTSRKLT